MTKIFLRKKISTLTFIASLLSSIGVFGQVIYTTINDDGSTTSITPMSFGNRGESEQQRENRANAANAIEAYKIQVSRFNQKLFISANVVRNMDASKDKISKYPYAQALYKKSLTNYKKLESISATAAQYVKSNKDISSLQNQQTRIINDAIDDYHKALYVQELGDNKAQIIQDEKMAFESERCLSKEEKAELAVLRVKIKDAQDQIAQLHKSGQPMDKIKDQLNNDYHVLAQSVNSAAKITEAGLEKFVPNQKIVKTINVTQKVFDTYVDEAIANGKSPTEAIAKAFENGYEELKKKEQDEKKTPTEKKIDAIKAMYEQTKTEIENWQRMDANRKQTMEKINEALDFTDDLVRRNQKLIDAAAAKGEKLTQRCIDEYVKRRLN